MTQFFLDTVRLGLQELADAEFQRRVWTGRGLPHEMSSLVEAVETVYDDSGLEPDLGLGRPVITDAIDARLRALGVLLGRIDHARRPDELIDDPVMEEVRQLAAAILEELPPR